MKNALIRRTAAFSQVKRVTVARSMSCMGVDVGVHARTNSILKPSLSFSQNKSPRQHMVLYLVWVNRVLLTWVLGVDPRVVLEPRAHTKVVTLVVIRFFWSGEILHTSNKSLGRPGTQWRSASRVGDG